MWMSMNFSYINFEVLLSPITHSSECHNEFYRNIIPIKSIDLYTKSSSRENLVSIFAKTSETWKKHSIKWYFRLKDYHSVTSRSSGGTYKNIKLHPIFSFWDLCSYTRISSPFPKNHFFKLNGPQNRYFLWKLKVRNLSRSQWFPSEKK